jgi:beta-lactamase regulating signal transducer with metallopeptidase domain
MISAVEDVAILRAIGWGLIRFLWEACLLVGAAAVALYLCRDRTPRSRHRIAMLAILAAPTLFVSAVFRSYQAVPARDLLMLPPELVAAYRALEGHRGHFTAVAWFDGWAAWIGLTWILGAGVLLLLLWNEWRSLRHAPRRVTTAVAHLVARAAHHLGVHQRVTVATVPHGTSPALLGLRRPVILLPDSVMANVPADQLELLIAHELAHVGRRDVAWALMQSCVEAVLFFHPLLHWLGVQARHERECATDDRVLQGYGEARAYGRALLRAAEGPGGSRLQVAAGRGSLVRRVDRMVHPASMPAPGRKGMAVATSMLLGVALQAGPARDAAGANATSPESEGMVPLEWHSHRNAHFRQSTLAVHQGGTGDTIHDLRLGERMRVIGVRSGDHEFPLLVESMDWRGSRLSLISPEEPAAASGDEWLKRAYHREAAVDVKRRIARIYSEQGVTGVLDDIEATGSEWARARSLEAALPLAASPEERAQVLRRVAALTDPASERQVLLAAVQQAGTPAEVMEVLRFADRLESDAEAEVLLVGALEHSGHDPMVRDRVVELTGAIGSAAARSVVRRAAGRALE